MGRYFKDRCPGPSPAEQAINIIKYAGDEIVRTGQKINDIPKGFFAIIGAPSPRLAGELLIELKSRGLLNGVEARTAGEPPILMDINLTLDGWQQYEAEKRGEIAGRYGFIALQFDDPELDPFVREVIKPAVKNTLNFELVDMRDVARAGVIDNIMRAQIRDAAFVLVDLTHDNSGAYWEAGFAEGLGKPVIYLCEKEKFEELKTHFDTNHCTTVIWSKDEPGEFTKELIATLRRSLDLF